MDFTWDIRFNDNGVKDRRIDLGAVKMCTVGVDLVVVVDGIPAHRMLRSAGAAEDAAEALAELVAADDVADMTARELVELAA